MHIGVIVAVFRAGFANDKLDAEATWIEPSQRMALRWPNQSPVPEIDSIASRWHQLASNFTELNVSPSSKLAVALPDSNFTYEELGQKKSLAEFALARRLLIGVFFSLPAFAEAMQDIRISVTREQHAGQFLKGPTIRSIVWLVEMPWR